MQILSLNFLFYTIGGVWRPIKWSSKCSMYLYSAFTLSTIYLLNFSVLTQLIDIVFVVDNMDDFATNSLMLLSAIAAFCKAITAVFRRSEIISLIKTLQEKPFKACNEEEIIIQMKYDCLIRQILDNLIIYLCNFSISLSYILLECRLNNSAYRSYTISYMILALFSATGAVIGEVLTALQGELPYRIWVPYDYTPILLFWLTSLHEMLALIFGTFVNIATETLLLGFCLQICAQLELFTRRLQRIVESDKNKEACNLLTNVPKRNRLSEHVYYHLHIIRFAEMVNEIFSEVLFVQFFASILILCSSVYYLSSHLVTDLSIFTFCMFVQIFVYCWAGNEVILKSTGLSEAACQIDWILMTISERKDLLMIMKRSIRPIKFTSSFLVTLSLDSYANVSTNIIRRMFFFCIT
ncbi:OR4 protein, partial [Acromyrmex insinuator]